MYLDKVARHVKSFPYHVLAMCLMPHSRSTTYVARLASCMGLLMLIAAGDIEQAEAQRPFRVYDPFYQQETARRTFFDGYALTAEVAYRAAGTLQDDGLQRANPDPFGVSVRFDYQLSSQIDLSAIIDASGGNTGRTLSVSWVVLKYYDCVENQDCLALRLAVDPSSDGQIGFPQLDLALITTTFLSPMLSNDFAVGVRRVRMGFEQWVPRETGGVDTNSMLIEETTPFDVLYTRALGTEVNLAMVYNVHFDPAGSHIFLALQAHGVQYELIETDLRADEAEAEVAAAGKAAAAPEPPEKSTHRGGALWARTGVEFNRPSFRIMPFAGLPLQQWVPKNRTWQEARLQAGVRFTLR